jgi:hypothetical protein
VIARSRVEEPKVLQKPTTTAALNATIAQTLGLSNTPEGAPRPEAVPEGGEERVR